VARQGWSGRQDGVGHASDLPLPVRRRKAGRPSPRFNI
jgi:hypothetical protein